MKSWIKSTTALTTASVLALGAFTVQAAPAMQDGDENVEEIIVTGSYIRRKNQADSASPISVSGREDMAAAGVSTMADFANTLTINNGSQNNPDAFTQNVSTGTSNINLRGLGVASTLVLMNGKRQVNSAAQTDGGVSFVDVSSLIPTIAVDQVEILKDGAGPLYGSDAVGGVVNFKTRSDFEGLEMDLKYQGVTGQSQRDLTAEIIWGHQYENTKVMAAFSYMDRSRLSMRDRDLRGDYGRANGLSISRASGYPGTFIIPTAPVGNMNDALAFLSVYDRVMPGYANPASPLLPDVIPNPSAGLPLPAQLTALGITTNPGPGYFPFPTVSAGGTVLFPGSAFTGFVSPDANAGQGLINIPAATAAFLGLGDGTSAVAIGANGVADAFEGLVNPIIHGIAAPGIAASLGVDPSMLSFPSVPNAEGALTPFFPDPHCQAVAQNNPDVLPNVTPITNPFTGEVSYIGSCDYDFNNQFDLVPKEERIQGYADFSHDFGNGVELYGEFGFALNQAKRGNSNFPITTVIPLPANYPFNPWGVDVFWAGRSPGSNFVNDPLNPNPSTHKNHTYRFLSGVRGEMSNGWSYDVSYMHAENKFKLVVGDGLKTNLLQALAGFGGENCDPNTGIPGQGQCMFYNVFGSGIVADANEKTPLLNSDLTPVLGPDGPLMVNVMNSDEIYDFIMGDVVFNLGSTSQVFDAVVSGELAEFGDTTISAAFGVQHRRETLGWDYDSDTNNNNYLFVTGADDFNTKRDVSAVFSEFLVPINDDLDIQAAMRYETYGGSIGSTFDPKVAVNYRPLDNMSFRASWGTSFRAPSVFQESGNQTTLQSVRDPRNDGEPFIAVKSQGVDGLTPEESTMNNIGFSWEALPGLVLSLDRWDYRFTNVIIQENVQDLVNRAFAGGETDLIGTKVFLDPTDGSIDSAVSSYANAGFIKTNGYDGSVKLTVENASGSLFSAGVEVTYVNKYDIQQIDGFVIHGEGSRNRDNFADPVPQFRGSVFAGWTNGTHAFNAFARRVGSFMDDQNTTFALRANGTPDFNNALDVVKVKSHTTVDLQYSYDFANGLVAENTKLTLGVINAFNKLPPFVFTDGGYEGRTHDPRGRVAYANLKINF